MGLFAIFDQACAAADVINLDREGFEVYTLIVKQSFTWDGPGTLRPIEPQPVIEADVCEGTPGAAVLFEAETVPRKPRVDVLLGGELVLAQSVDRVLALLEVGAAIRKGLVVFGDRVWLPGGLASTRPSAPLAFARMPITWSRSFGGVDPKSPMHLDPRNPVGVGYAHRGEHAGGQRLPNFEAPNDLLSSWRDRPVPVGFGPVGRSWPSRVGYGGTYDRRWLEEDFPSLPSDFDERFFNAAPEDQQLDVYRAGETVRLCGMTPEWDTRFSLPSFAVPVTVLERRDRTAEYVIQPDTILIEPGERRVSILGRQSHVPQPNALAIEDVLVGTPSPGWLRARSTRKTYLGRTPRRA